MCEISLQAKSLAKKIIIRKFEECDYSNLMELLDGKNQAFHFCAVNRFEELQKESLEHFQQDNFLTYNNLQVSFSNVNAVEFANQGASVFGEIVVCFLRGKRKSEKLYFTMVLKRDCQTFVLEHFHLSCNAKNKSLCDCSNLMFSENPTTREALTITQNTLKTKGFARCKKDKEFSLIYASDEFIKFAGYTREQIKNKFQNKASKLFQEVVEEDLCLDKYSFRVVKKSSENVWVSINSVTVNGEDGEEYIFVALYDVSNLEFVKIKQNEKSEYLDAFINMSEIIFDWNVFADKVLFSKNWFNTFNYEPIRENALQQLLNSNKIHPSDKCKIEDVVKRFKNRESYVETDVRILRENGEYLWVFVRCSATFNEKGDATHVMGSLLNVDEFKRKTIELEKRVQRDCATGLYNKKTIENLITKVVHNANVDNECGVLLFVDMDNLKDINDNHGHLIGDQAINELAQILITISSKRDLVGRIGGDEFVVYLRDSNIFSTTQKIELLYHKIAKVNRERKNANYNLSVSIGVSLQGIHGETYVELINSADKALYSAKEHGKGKYVFAQTVEPV